MASPDLNAFQQWVADMAEGAGLELPADLDPMGLELEVEGRMARVMAHSDDSLAVVEVDVRSLNEVDDALLGAVGLALLRLNQEARFEHGWAIVLDEDDRLSITTTLVMAQTASQVLKTFNHGETPTLYAGRKAKLNEATAAYLVSKKEAGYAQKAGVAETQYFTVAVGGKFQMVDSLGLRALLKRHPEGSVKLHEIVMEKVDGQEAFDHVAEGKLKPAQRKDLTRQMLTSLKELNRRGFVVRDHKWENVMYDPATNKAKLIDTGMFHKVSKTQRETRFIKGEVGGTAVYMHARALTGAMHASETDVYAQGIMTLVLEHPVAMGIMIDRYLQPFADQALIMGRKGDRIEKGIGSADFRKMVEQELQRNPMSPSIRNLHSAIRNPDSLSGLAMKCLDMSNVPWTAWATPGQAQSMFANLLAHPSLN